MAAYLTSIREFAALTDEQRAARSAALDAIALARREGMTVDAAARNVGVTMDEVREWAPSALHKGRWGDGTRPTGEDDIARVRPLIVEVEGHSDREAELTFVFLGGSKEAGRADRAFSIQWDYVHGQGSARTVEKLDGLAFDGRQVVSDPEVLRRLADAGDLDVPEAYREAMG